MSVPFIPFSGNRIMLDTGTYGVIDNNIEWGITMDVTTGKLYTEEEAKELPEEKQKDLVWMQGGVENITAVSKAVKARAKKARKQAKKSRRQNRG